jgi:fatty-acyl-CoA synthase
MNPVHALYDNLPAKAESPAIHDGDFCLTHADLIAHVETAASDLIHRGIAPGHRVGLCATNSWRHVVGYLAILRSNAVWVPLNPRNGAGLNTYLQARAGLALTLHDTASAAAAGQTTTALNIDDWIEAPLPTNTPTLPPILDDRDATFAIKFTGGSTGTPKGVVQSQASASCAMASLNAFYGFTPDDVNLAVAPLTHGASHYILPVLAAGGAHVLLAEPSREAVLAELKTRVSIVFMPPTLIYLLMAEAAFRPEDLPRLRHLTYSAAPMPPARITQAIARFGPVVGTLYGQTEAPMTIAALTPGQMQDPALHTSVGRAFQDTPMGVLCEDGQVCTANAKGEVVVKGDLAATTYLDDPAQTTQARHSDWLKTGDIGRLDAEGHLFLLGRSKEMIISGGYNIYPAEVETALAAHPNVREACAFGVEDASWGERLEAAVALYDPSGDLRELTAFVRDRIGPVRTPKTLHRLDALPRNPVGKVVRADVIQLVHPATRPAGLRTETLETAP